jgi:hypothetical protein
MVSASLKRRQCSGRRSAGRPRRRWRSADVVAAGLNDPVSAEYGVTSRDLRILAEEAAEPVPALNPGVGVRSG